MGWIIPLHFFDKDWFGIEYPVKVDINQRTETEIESTNGTREWYKEIIKYKTEPEIYYKIFEKKSVEQWS